MLYAILLWLSTSFVVGYLGRKRALGFWGVFIFSLLFSPAVGLVGLWVCRSDDSEVVQKQAQLVSRYKKLLVEVTGLQEQNTKLKEQIGILEATLQQVPHSTVPPG